MLPKGFVKVSVAKSTEARLLQVRNQMIAESPDKYDENTGLHTIICWLLDNNQYQQ